MRYSITILLFGLVACTTPQPEAPSMSLDEAMEHCRAEVEEQSRTKTTVGVGVGVSDGKVRPTGGIRIGIDLTSDDQKQKNFESCVVKKSGQEATEAL